MSKRDIAPLRARIVAQLGKTEAALRNIDRADDEIGAHATAAEKILIPEIQKRAKAIGAPAGAESDDEAEFRYLLGQRRRAADVGLAAARARQRRG